MIKERIENFKTANWDLINQWVDQYIDRDNKKYHGKDLADGHVCTSDCRREGCPLCTHGVHEDIGCNKCDI